MTNKGGIQIYAEKKGKRHLESIQLTLASYVRNIDMEGAWLHYSHGVDRKSAFHEPGMHCKHV